MEKNKEPKKEDIEKELKDLIEENNNRSNGIKKIINSIDKTSKK